MLVKLRCEHIYYPSVKLPGDVGLDLMANKHIDIPANHLMLLWDSGVFVEDIAPGYWLQIVDKSGRAAQGLHVIGGIIDTGYRGQLGVIMAKLIDRSISISPGEAVCQVVIHAAVYPAESVETNGKRVAVGSGERGQNGGLWEVGR